MALDDLQFTPELLSKPDPAALTVETALRHFVVVTFLVDPATLHAQLPPRFEPDCVDVDGDGPHALVSVVTFLDQDFHFVGCPWIKNTFGQTNYRAYVTDTVTGEHVVWFFGTCLDSPWVAVPRIIWKLPWHRARIAFDCRYDDSAGRYTSFAVTTTSRFAPARLEIEDLGEAPTELSGFTNLEAGLVFLTHPRRGVFNRSDGSVGTYSIWHDRLRPTAGRVKQAQYPLLEQLEMIPRGRQGKVHSVLIQPSVDFTIYLPPRRIRDGC